MQSDLRREREAWTENRGQGGIPWTDDITAPTAQTRFTSVQEHLPHFLRTREKQSAPSTPSADGAEGLSHAPGNAPVGVSESAAQDSAHATNNVNGVDENDMALEQGTR